MTEPNMHMQMIEPIPELAGIDPTPSMRELAPSVRIAIQVCGMSGDELAGRLAGDPASAVAMIEEIADARRYVAALAGILEHAELRLLAAVE